MTLADMLEFDAKRPGRIHQSIPREQAPQDPLVAGKKLALLCQEPDARHHMCQWTSCECQCHVDHENMMWCYGMC